MQTLVTKWFLTNNEELKKNYFETLEYILGIHGSIENDSQVNQTVKKMK